MIDEKKTDAMLRRALGGVEAPDPVLLRQVKASLGKEQDMKTNHTTRRIITLALAAALVLALSITAYAAYMASIQDYVAEPSAAETEAPAENWTRISWNGYQGTPEYTAWSEWQNWYDANATAMVAETGNAPVDSPYANYGDYTEEGRKVLEDIAEKNGVKLHTAMANGYAEDIYEVLGTEPFLPEDSMGSGYVYEDGSFKLEGIEGLAGLDGTDVTWTLFAGAKGSITSISSALDMTDGCEEWTYETGGQTLDLVLANGQGVMLLETPGAYLYADAVDWNGSGALDRQTLEAAADEIGFDILADRFDGSSHPETAEKLEALQAKNAQGTTGYEDFEGVDTFLPLAEKNPDGLGRYGVDALTADFADHLYWSENFNEVFSLYSRDNRTYQFEYVRLAAEEQQAYLDERLSALEDPDLGWAGTVEKCDVNGMPGLLELDKEHPDGGVYAGTVIWCDQEAEIRFQLSIDVSQTYGEPITGEDLLTLAESVTLAE